MASQPQEQPELVEVFDTQQESEAWAVQGLLESAGIEAAVITLDAPRDILPGVGGILVRVNADQADDARRIIEDYRKNPPTAAEEESEAQ